MSEIAKHLGKILKKAREDKGLSQRELASILQLTQSHVSKIERGEVDFRVSTFIELSRVLDKEPMLIPRSLIPLIRGLLRGEIKEGVQIPAYRPDEELGDE